MTNRLRRLPNSPVRLEHFWIERFSLDLGDTPPLDDDLSEPSTRYSVSLFEFDDDPDLYRVQLRLRSERRGRSPEDRQFDVQLSGVFEFPPEFSPIDRQPFLEFNAPAILYGVARGLIASISGVGSLDALQIPSADFLHDAE